MSPWSFSAIAVTILSSPLPAAARTAAPTTGPATALAMKLGMDAEAAGFVKESPDEESADWAYMRALLAYRLERDSVYARTELRRAIRLNRHVVPCLLSSHLDDVPDTCASGSCEEAALCASQLYSVFAAAPGTREWFDSKARRERRQRERERDRKKRR